MIFVSRRASNSVYVKDGCMNSNFESDSFIDVLLFFIRYRFRIIVGVVIGLMISLIIYLVFPVNSVPFVYSIHQKAQIRISAYMPSLQVQELMVDLPNNYMRAWILDPNRLVQTVFLVDKEIGAKLKEPNERMA